MLSQTMQASRNSVRAALAQLKTTSAIVSIRRYCNKIAARFRATPRGRTSTVGVLIPESIGWLRPSIALWIDELKDLLAEDNYHLRVHEGAQYYSANPGPSLDRLLSQASLDAWVLVLSSHKMQMWFSQREVACLVAGSVFNGINLPSFDIEHRP